MQKIPYFSSLFPHIFLTLKFHSVRILPDDFSLRRLLANFSVCHELLDLFFVISEALSDKVRLLYAKVLHFSDKIRSCRIAFFSILYSWQWPHKGLSFSRSLMDNKADRLKASKSSLFH